MKKLRLVLLVFLILAAVLVFVRWDWLRTQYANLIVALPIYISVAKTAWLDQHWTPGQRDWFYHADQGTQTFNIPYEWFVSFEQPALSLGTPGLLSDSAYLDRFGFIPSLAAFGK